jgi:hypothetical protein
MTNKDRARKLLSDIKAVDEESGVGLILTYAMEIRREAEAVNEMACCNEMVRSTEYAIVEWQRRLEQAHHRLALARGEENE